MPAWINSGTVDPLLLVTIMDDDGLVGGGSGLPLAPQSRASSGMSAGLVGGSSLDGSSAAGLSNLETIIAATVRAVTGQLGCMDGSAADGAMLRRNATAAGAAVDVAGTTGSGAFSMNRWSGPGVAGSTDGVWGADATRRSGMPSADAVRSGMLASDNDPNTLYVGNVSICLIPLLHVE